MACPWTWSAAPSRKRSGGCACAVAATIQSGASEVGKQCLLDCFRKIKRVGVGMRAVDPLEEVEAFSLEVGGTLLVLINVEGLILYSDATQSLEELVAITTIAAARQFLRSPRALVGVVNEGARIGRLATMATGARSYQLGNQLGLATILATLGGF